MTILCKLFLYGGTRIGVFAQRQIPGADPGGVEPAYTPPPPLWLRGKKKKGKTKGEKKGGGGRNRRTKREPAYSPLSEKKNTRKT